jgi:hypothetical protein
MSEIVYQGQEATIEDMVISPHPEIPSGGFSVNSIMMKGGSSSNVFDNLVVPNWAWSLPTEKPTEEKTIGGRAKHHIENKKEQDENEDIIDDDLYNTLLELATENMKSNKKTNKKKKATTKKRKRKHENKNNQTKKKKKGKE